MDLYAQFAQLRTPGYRRSVIIRRIVAVVLVIAAALHVIVGVSRDDPAVVVFAREVAPGTTLTGEDVALRRLPADAVPQGALSDLALAEGQLLAAAASAGEVVTSTRLVGPDLTATLIAEEPPGEEFSLVPVPVAESDIIPLLHHGARVDVIAQGPRTVATGGRVVTSGEKGTVLVLFRQSQAEAVAAASLDGPLTLLLSRHIQPPSIP